MNLRNIEDLNKINWDRLKVFYNVVQCGNYKDAAVILKMSQPNISRHISLLEEEFGAELIIRKGGTRGNLLTKNGQILMSALNHVYLELNDAQNDMKDSSTVSGTIEIATARGFGNYWLVPRIFKFLKEYPDIDISLNLANSFYDLHNYDSDIYLGPKYLEDPNLTHEFLGEYSFGIYASKEYLAQYGTPNTPEDLNNHKLIINKVNQKLHALTWLETAGLQKGNKRKSHLLFDDTMQMVAAVENGLGIASFLDYVALKTPHLIRLFEKTHIGSLQIFLTFNSKNEISRRLKIFMDFLLSSGI